MRVPLSKDADEGLPRVVRRNPTKLVKKLCSELSHPSREGERTGRMVGAPGLLLQQLRYKGYVYLEDRRGEDADQGRGREETAAGPRRP